jgi:hypothetical protein
LHCQGILIYRFNLILDQVQGYETRLQQQQTELENASEKLDSAGKECWRLSSENGNFISKVIYHFHDGNVFACAFQNCLRERKENTDERTVQIYHNTDRQSEKKTPIKK